MGTICCRNLWSRKKHSLCDTLSKELKIPVISAGDLISSKNGERYGATKPLLIKYFKSSWSFSMQAQKPIEVTPQIVC